MSSSQRRNVQIRWFAAGKNMPSFNYETCSSTAWNILNFFLQFIAEEKIKRWTNAANIIVDNCFSTSDLEIGLDQNWMKSLWVIARPAVIGFFPNRGRGIPSYLPYQKEINACSCHLGFPSFVTREFLAGSYKHTISSSRHINSIFKYLSFYYK